MSVTIIRRQRRIRSMKEMGHNPSGHGKGKWHCRRCLWVSRIKRHVRNQMASASRKRNRL